MQHSKSYGSIKQTSHRSHNFSRGLSGRFYSDTSMNTSRIQAKKRLKKLEQVELSKLEQDLLAKMQTSTDPMLSLIAQ